MKAHSAAQMDLLEMPPSVSSRQGRPCLAMEIDHRSWMRFLNEEWLQPRSTGVTLLGVGRPVAAGIGPNMTPVGIWFDQEKLPAMEVWTFRAGSWVAVSIDDLTFSDTNVAWPGPLPLFAVDHFTFETAEAQAHMMSMVRHFADIEVPSQPVLIDTTDKIASMEGPSIAAGDFLPPANWDALRGASSMALYAVPAIGPWLSVFCDLVNCGHSAQPADVIKAPWLSHALWDGSTWNDAKGQPLWHAIVRYFSRPGTMRDWQAQRILHDVCDEARKLGYDDEALRASSTLLLEDKGTIETVGLRDDPVALALQLVLLRPTPAKYVNWKDDWPAVPPGAWWTGAILSGFLSGYKALPLELRGGQDARRILALRTWQLSTADGKVPGWGGSAPNIVNWALASDVVIIHAEHAFLAELKLGNRGRWYQLDLHDDANVSQAVKLAELYCPVYLNPFIILADGDVTLLGGGRAALLKSGKTLHIDGRLEIAIGANVKIEQRLDIEQFRHWLLTSSIESKLPRISGLAVNALVQAPGGNLQGFDEPAPSRLQSANHPEPPAGLAIIEGFISAEQEALLLDAIDAAPWDTSMTRRVQHYGWRYDYKARKVDPAAYLGALPDWAATLGHALFKSGRLAELPDQVIVNEYVGSQSISKHVDCPTCFRGAIVTVSLNESWEMLFTRPILTGGDEKYRVILPRRSAAFLDGPARSEWKHEIPKRAKDNGVKRQRRVSITFRKVATAV